MAQDEEPDSNGEKVHELEVAPKRNEFAIRESGVSLVDFIAGCAISRLAIPQDVGYAKLAGASPVIGLYSTSVPPFVYLKLAFTATFFCGDFQTALGVFRKFVTKLLSHAAVVVFMADAAVTTALQQLQKLLNIAHIISVKKSAVGQMDEWNWRLIAIGNAFMRCLIATKSLAWFTGGTRIQYLILDLTPVANVDTSGVIAFEELEKTLKRKKMQLALANKGTLLISTLDQQQV